MCFSFQSCIGNSRMVQLECPDNDCHAVLPDVCLKEILPKDFLSRCVSSLQYRSRTLKNRGRTVGGGRELQQFISIILKREGGGGKSINPPYIAV